MRDNSIKTRILEEEETDSWVYTYTTDYSVEPIEGSTCKIVTTTPASKYNGSLSQEMLNNSFLEEHTVLVNGRNTLEVEPQNSSISFKICEKGEVGHEMHLTLNLKDACVVLGMLAQAIEEVSSARSKQADQ